MPEMVREKSGLIGFLADPLGPGRRRRRRNFAGDFLQPTNGTSPELPAEEVRRVVFFNHFHNGDVHLARGIVREIVRRLPKAEFVYSHGCPSDILADMPAIQHDSAIYKTLANNRPYKAEKSSRTVYFNTWIGCLGTEVVQAAGGCNILLLWKMLASSARRSMGIELPPVSECVPEPDFTRFCIQHLEAFMQKDSRPKILISNGKVLSMQSADFDFTPYIEALADTFPDILFIPSNPTTARRKNIIQSADIIRKDGPDLNENGYLSTFCHAVIGRSSGSYSFSIHRRNLLAGKLFLSFCHCPLEASLGFDDPIFSTRTAFVATNDFRPHLMLRRMIHVVKLATEQKTCPEPTVEVMIS